MEQDVAGVRSQTLHMEPSTELHAGAMYRVHVRASSTAGKYSDANSMNFAVQCHLLTTRSSTSNNCIRVNRMTNRASK